MALDYGRRRIGVAISDPLKLIAQPYDTWQNRSLDEVVSALMDLISRYHVDTIVLGYPISMNGGESVLTKEVERFGRYLRQKLEIPVIFWDERLTSVQARKTMILLNTKRDKNKGKIDRMAAVFILQNYMENQNQMKDVAGKKEHD